MSKKLLVALLLCANVRAIAQISGPFSQLDFSNCETGILLNLASRGKLPPSPDTLSVLSYRESAHWLHVLHESSIDESPSIPSWNEIRQTELRHVNAGVVSISLAHVSYNFVRPDALINGDITFVDSVFQMQPGTDIYETGVFMLAHLSQDYWPESSVKFMLDESLLFNDWGSSPMTLEWDPGDGQGWRLLEAGVVNEIHYSDQSHHTLMFRFTDDEQGVSLSGSVLKSGGCSSDYPMPVAPPWVESNSVTYPFGISCLSDGISVSGNTYYLPSGEFDKPFIFVEGIDFTPLQSAMQNGDFGWCQFTSGYEAADYPYSMISLMPKFLDSLRVRGYDIILVDFADGALSMNDNASLLIALIQRVNEFKIGDEPNVIAGASMGGQVCRHALKRMEDLDQEHCCRLWISFDSPHAGAYVPIALQQLLDALSDQPLAANAIDDKLLSPAAKQMLVLQHFQDSGYEHGGTADFENWYSNAGYPSECRKIAVTNGSLTGAIQRDQEGHVNSYYDPLLSYNCDALPCSPGPEARFFMTPSSGDPWYNDANGFQSTASSNVTAQVVLSELSIENGITGTLVGGLLGGIIGGVVGGAAGVLCFPDQQITTYSSPSSLPNYDYAPGGYSNSLVEILAGINGDGSLTDAGCPVVSDDNANLLHCFIPTASALGIEGAGLYENIENLIDANPEICPFDAYFGPSDHNQPHTHLSWENMRFLLDEITGGEDSFGEALIPDQLVGQTFNYGKAGYHELAPVVVSGNGRICINGHMPFRFGSAGEPFPDNNSHFVVSSATGCTQSITQILNGGRLEVGDNSQLHTAELKIRRDAILRIGAGGTLLICSGSKLSVESGGKLILEPGSTLLINNADIEILNGGQLEYNGGSISIQGNTARLIFNEGVLQVASNQMCHLNMITPGSSIIVRSQDNPSVQLGLGSTLKLTASHLDHVALLIEEGKNFMISGPPVSYINLFNCGVQLSDGCRIQSLARWNAENVRFQSAMGAIEVPSVILNNNTSRFTLCKLDNIRVKTNSVRLITRSCESNASDFRILEGSYSISDCVFHDSYIRSDELTYTSTVMNSHFYSCNDNFIRDMSLTELILDGCSFIDCETYAVKKSGGMLSMRCNSFQSVRGVEANYATVNMSYLLGAGYNTFDDCYTCLKFEDLNELLIQKGFNDFSGYTNRCMMGTINQNCSDNCELQLDAHYNKWHSYNSDLIQTGVIPCNAPDQEDFFVQTSDGSPCGGYEAGGCEIVFFDAHPICETKCSERKFVKSKVVTDPGFELKNDVVTPILYNGLLYNADELWGYCTDSVMNDTVETLEVSNDCLFTLFMALDSNYVDSIRHEYRDRIRLMMKRNIEVYLAVTDDPFATEDFVTEKYIDIMNVMTDTVLTSETYKSQFYRELDKAQFFLSIGRSHAAKEVLDNMDNCLLDSVETDILSIWQARAIEVLNFEAVADSSEASVFMDLVLTDTAISLPNMAASNYYFGCFIAGHDDYSFVGCGDNPEYRNQTISSGNIYPNPADDRIYLKDTDSSGPIDIFIYDMSGRQCFSQSGLFGTESAMEVMGLGNLPEGIYSVEYSTGVAVRRQLLQVVH